MKIWGIDVSKYNYPIDWTKVKNAGVQFAILRVSSYRNMKNPNSIYKDPYFETFYKGAKAVGLPVGCYFYSQCENEVQAKKEANFVLECIKGKQFEYPIWIDVENIHTLQTTTKAQLTNAVITAMDILEKNGYYTGIYTGKYILRDELNDSKLDKYDKWINRYFAYYRDGKVFAYDCGATSWSVDNSFTNTNRWEYAKLANEEDIRKYAK